MKKYEFTGKTIDLNGYILHQIVCVTAFEYAAVGEIGGYIEKEDNLSHDGNAWVGKNAWAYGNAKIYDDAIVYGNARVCGNAKIHENARVCENAQVFDDAEVCGNARVFGGTILRRGQTKNSTDYIAIGPQGPFQNFATFQIPSNTVCTGRFVGSLDEFKAKVEEKYGSCDCEDYKLYYNQYQCVIDMFKRYPEMMKTNS